MVSRLIREPENLPDAVKGFSIVTGSKPMGLYSKYNGRVAARANRMRKGRFLRRDERFLR
jgi:hypothetical protein